MSFCSDGTEGSERGEKATQTVVFNEVKEEWRSLWRNRIDDKTRAEGVANHNYSLLFVESGTVIVATRDFKPLDLKEILTLNKVENAERLIAPHPSVGGWRKFSRTVLNKQSRVRKWNESLQRQEPKKNLQLKKCGRGWLHRTLGHQI